MQLIQRSTWHVLVCSLVLPLAACSDPVQVQCKAGESFCSASCVNLQTDPNPCGMCGNSW